MTRLRDFQSNSKAYEDYYCAQAGHGLPVFIGGRSHRGRGFGNLLGSIGRSILPILKRGGKSILKESLRSGMEIAGDVLSGKNLTSSVKERARHAGKRLLDKAMNKMTGGAGLGVLAPPGEPRRKRIKTVTTRRPETGNRKKRKKTVPKDIFD